MIQFGTKVLFYKLIESGIGGKTYDVNESMYTKNNCAVKIGNNKQTDFFSEGRVVKEVCPISPTLFNIYIKTSYGWRAVLSSLDE